MANLALALAPTLDPALDLAPAPAPAPEVVEILPSLLLSRLLFPLLAPTAHLPVVMLLRLPRHRSPLAARASSCPAHCCCALVQPSCCSKLRRSKWESCNVGASLGAYWKAINTIFYVYKYIYPKGDAACGACIVRDRTFGQFF